MSDSNPISDQNGEYTCKICGMTFLTSQALASTHRFRTSGGRTTRDILVNDEDMDRTNLNRLL